MVGRLSRRGVSVFRVRGMLYFYLWHYSSVSASFVGSCVCVFQAEEMEGRPRSQPDDLINFRQLRSNALQAAELDIYDGDDIRLVLVMVLSCSVPCLLGRLRCTPIVLVRRAIPFPSVDGLTAHGRSRFTCCCCSSLRVHLVQS